MVLHLLTLWIRHEQRYDFGGGKEKGGRKNNEDEEIRAPSRPDTELSVVPQGIVLEL